MPNEGDSDDLKNSQALTNEKISLAEYLLNLGRMLSKNKQMPQAVEAFIEC